MVGVTGPEHYAEAERLLELASADCGPVDNAIRAEAQVHATLALAAATISAAAHPNQSQVDYLSGWLEATA